jgi:hypothetical protein
MSRRRMKLRTTALLPMALAGLLATLLAACGGGGGDDDAAADDGTVPASAQTTPESFVQWLGSRQASDERDPLPMAGVMPPTSDTAEPIEVN